LQDKLRRADVASRYRALLATEFVRTVPLGCDCHSYWVLKGDNRVFVEQVTCRSDAPSCQRNLSTALAAGGALPLECSAVAKAAAAARAVISNDAIAAAAAAAIELQL
jgi:DNA-binding IclR family transcriptional regulator